MSELSDLSELLTGAIVAQASVTRVVHADQLDEIRTALMTSFEANLANCEVGRGAVLTYLDALESERPEGPSDPPPVRFGCSAEKATKTHDGKNERQHWPSSWPHRAALAARAWSTCPKRSTSTRPNPRDYNQEVLTKSNLWVSQSR